MHVLRRLTRAVFGCFHGLERFFDRWTSRAGPIFVVLCTLLLLLGTVTYCQCSLTFVLALWAVASCLKGCD
jgi:hypothetical protein